MKGKKVGLRQVVLQSGYFPAPLIFLPAGYPATGGRGGNKNRVSRGVVSSGTALLTGLGGKMKGAGTIDTAGWL
ncbi:hypothetical protein Rcae01_00671 [Novipirellula caenicola]|uniref:Uncharacterized protein n=1 Tax=Novipirellula caenicola TaxID=1536901 RepID=A0ABP9VJ53_9BACT